MDAEGQKVPAHCLSYLTASARINITHFPIPLWGDNIKKCHYTTFFKNLFIYLFILAALGLCCCARAFSSCGERGLLFVAVCGLLIAVASLVVEHRL